MELQGLLIVPELIHLFLTLALCIFRRNCIGLKIKRLEEDVFLGFLNSNVSLDFLCIFTKIGSFPMLMLCNKPNYKARQKYVKSSQDM